MPTPNPSIYFGPGTVMEFDTLMALPAAIYTAPNATEITLSNFHGTVRNSLRTIGTAVSGLGIDLAEHTRVILDLIDAQLVIDKAFVAAFKTDINVTYAVNLADDNNSIALSLVVTFIVPQQSEAPLMSRQFFHSTVNANMASLVGGRIYGNASDLTAP